MVRILVIASIVFSGQIWAVSDQNEQASSSNGESYVFSENETDGAGGSVFAGDSLAFEPSTSHLLSYGGNFFFSFGTFRLGVEGALLQRLDSPGQSHVFYFGPFTGATFKFGIFLFGVSSVFGYGNCNDKASFSMAPSIQLGLHLAKGASVSLVGKFIMFINGDSQVAFFQKSFPFFGLQVSFGSV